MLPRSKIHQKQLQRHGSPTNIFPRPRLPSRPPCTTASPDKSSEPSPRDACRFFLTTPHASHHHSKVVSGSSHVLVLFSGLRHGWTAPIAAIATRLLLWWPPGDRERSHPVTCGDRAAPVLTDSTGSAGFEQTPSTRPDASSKPGLVAQQLETSSHNRRCADSCGILLVQRFALSRQEEDHGRRGHRACGQGKQRGTTSPAQPTRTCTVLTGASLKHQSLRLLRVYHSSSHQSIPFMRMSQQKVRSLAQVGHGISRRRPRVTRRWLLLCVHRNLCRTHPGRGSCSRHGLDRRHTFYFNASLCLLLS